MLCVESIDSLADLRRSHGLRDLVLETPRALARIEAGNPPRVRISGWVLADYARSDIAVSVAIRGVEHKIPVRRSRPDVSEAHALGPEYSWCGFDAELPIPPLFQQQLEIGVIVGENCLPWRRIVVRAEVHGYELPNKIWNSLSNGDWTALSEDAELSFDPQKVEKFIEEQRAQHFCLSKPQDLTGVSWVNPQSRKLLNAICERYARPSATQEMVEQALSNGALEISFGGDAEPYVCSASIAVAHMNFLVFTSATDSFLLIQYCYSAVGVFYPRLNLSISWAHWGGEFVTWISMLNRYMLTNFRAMASYFSRSGKRSFGYFLLVNERPYHYFYDHVAVLCHLARQSEFLTTRTLPIALLEPYAYAPVSNLLASKIEETRFSDADAINKYNCANRCFSILIGGPNRALVGSDNTIEYFEGLVSALTALAKTNSGLSARIQRLRACTMVLWLGVTSQKRMWIEQEEGLVQIVTLLHQRNPSLAVVFDGWTSPLSPKESDLKEAEKDRQVMNRIVARLPAGIVIDSLIGATSAEKIAVGVEVDHYITNWLQGSLHVDNICKKPGVGHFNTHWRSYDTMYYHHQCVRIADELITNVGEGRADMLSYSISWQEIYRALLDLMAPVAVTATSS